MKCEWLKHLKQKWGIQSTWDAIVICVVFSLAGMSIVYVRRPFFHFVGITAETPFLIKFFTWALIVFPTYQINLIIFGTLLGQFRFFWEKEKEMGRFLLRIITRPKTHKASHK